MRFPVFAHVALTLLLAVPAAAPGAPPEPAGLPLRGQEAEDFLKSARVVLKEPLGVGITHSDRVTLEDGAKKSRAIWKTINEHKAGLQKLENGGSEFDFRDSYKAEVAAYELDKLLGLDLVPATVERRIDGRVGSLQFWVEHAMTELERKQKGLEPPDVDLWNQQLHKVRLLHQLTYNTDHQNIRNVLLDPSFRVYAVDSSRAFHVQVDLLVPGDLVRFSRSVVARMEALDKATLKEHLGAWIGGMQIDGLLARRNKILAIVKQRVAEKGEAAVLY